MDNFHKHYNKVVLITTVGMLIAIGLWLMNPLPMYAGFVLGATVSILNTYIIYRNVVRTTEVTHTSGTNLRHLSGTSLRVFFVIIAVFFAGQADNVDVFATLFGAFFAQIVAYIYFFMIAFSTQDLKGGKM